MDWYEEAKKLRAEGKSLSEIANILNMSYKTVESRFYRDNLRGNKQPVKLHKQLDNLQDSILKELSKGCAINYLCDKYKATERVIRATIEDIKEAGYLVTDQDGTIKLCKDVISTENKHSEIWTGEKVIRFGVVSDNHLCSRWQQLTFLNNLYDLFKSEGIQTVYNCGDLTEGFKMRPGHEHEIFKYGADDQTQYVIDVYPEKPGIVTKFITGNHDHSHIKNGGVDIGIRIAEKRKDMVYLGLSNAKVKLTPNCIAELNHPLDGAAYALSYAPQKTIDAMSGGEKPNILLNGHHHKIFYMMYRNIHAYECGTTQAQTPFMRGKRIAANVGGLIVEAHVDEEGTIKRCKGEYIPQYKSIEHDY